MRVSQFLENKLVVFVVAGTGRLVAPSLSNESVSQGFLALNITITNKIGNLGNTLDHKETVCIAFLFNAICDVAPTILYLDQLIVLDIESLVPFH